MLLSYYVDLIFNTLPSCSKYSRVKSDHYIHTHYIINIFKNVLEIYR